ncbi:MAG: hypothetical protein U1F68_07075 [Gammaproteobacteria bacterium]
MPVPTLNLSTPTTAHHPVKRLALAVAALGLIAAPVLAHFAVVHGHRLGYALGCALLGLLALWPLRPRIGFWWWLVPLAVGLAFALTDRPELYYAPALIVYGVLMLGFARTLLPGRKPLITGLAERYHGGQLQPQALRYTRLVTLAWSLLFAVLLLEVVALAVFAPIALGSFFVNVLNYLIIIVFFLVEFWLRHYLVTDTEHASLLELLRFLRQAGHGAVRLR